MSKRLATLDKWREMAFQDHTATFFQTPFWLTSIAKARNLQCRQQGWPWKHPRYHAQAMIWERGGVTCALPMLRIQYPWGSYFENPLGTYGGLICIEDQFDPFLSQIKNSLRRHAFYFTQSPYRPWPFHFGVSQIDRTFVIDCQTPKGGPIEKNWRKTRKEELRKGQRHGFEVRLAPPGRDGDGDAEAFVRLYHNQIQSWGARARTMHSPELFDIIRQDVPQQHYRLFMVENHQGLAACLLAFEFHGRLHAWCCASTDDSKSKGVHAVMHHGILSYARTHGLETYDLNPSGSLPGVEAFKISLGARPLPILRNYQINATFRLFRGFAKLKQIFTM